MRITLPGIVFTAIVVLSGSAEAQEPSGTRRLLIFCGHPGDAEHRQQYAESIDQLVEALTTNWNFSADAVRVLFGTPEMQEDGAPLPGDVGGPCTLKR